MTPTPGTAPRRFSDAQHPYSTVRRAGDVLFVAGQLGVAGGDIVAGGVVAEARQAFANLTAALSAEDLTTADLVKVTVYLVDMADRPAMDEVYVATLGEPRPARTCVAVAQLPFGARIELDAVAAVASPTRRAVTGDLRVHVIATGGTIDKEYSVAGELEIGDPMVPAILATGRSWLDLSVEAVCGKDSLDLTDEDRALIRRHVLAAPADRVLITHGTDTMVDTATVLSDVADRVVVLTGAMVPARMTDSDAAFNLGLAVAALQTMPPGVWIAMSGRIFAADAVRKDTTIGRFVDAPRH
ncbi:Rid family hydrolase [Nakamurella deserti]|uniref:Rid family hydrolase n=1 Tax=Nakamurella deserti TaxID=2164074 RepID=UPI00197B0880|nr:Rid family hydrolase [Nakamurella deserti]